RFTEAVDLTRQPQDEVYDAAYYRRQAQKAVREAGWGQLLYKMAQELNRRRRALFQKLRGLWLKRAYLLVSVTGPANFISRQTMSYLIAANDLIAHYPALLNKRAKIQAARRRTDAELFRIFQRPFGIVSPKPHYAQTQHELAALFGLDKLADNVS
ncbi:MAG: hypothetical protein ACE5G8_15245, partial [Anaerolineae bacterium]